MAALPSGAGPIGLFGLDEAGYGPILGPLVLVTAGVRIREPAPVAQLNQRLQQAVDQETGLRVADSKTVYRGPKNLARLELSGLALWCAFLRSTTIPTTLKTLWQSCTGRPYSVLTKFPWHRTPLRLPLVVEPARVLAAANALQRRWRSAGIHPLGAHARVVFPPEFNRICDECSSKNKALLRWTIELLRAVDPPRVRRTILIMDQQGGRKDYTALISALQPDGRFQLIRQGGLSPSAGRYNDPFSLVVEPRADARYSLVAACSIMAKYLRELFMHQWNQYWSNKAALPPTSGYNARSYLAQMRALAEHRPDLRPEIERALDLYVRRR